MRLVLESLRTRWVYPPLITLVAGVLVATWEAVYQGRVPSEFTVTFPWMWIAGIFLPFFNSEVEVRENRAVLLKILPVTTLNAAVSRAVVPLLLFVPPLLVTVAAARLLGAFGLFSQQSLRLLALSLVLAASYCVTGLWAELKPRLLQLRYGRAIFFGTPMVVGGLFGATFALHAKRTFEQSGETGDLFTFFIGLLGLEAMLWAAVVVVLLSSATVILFIRRESYL